VTDHIFLITDNELEIYVLKSDIKKLLEINPNIYYTRYILITRKVIYSGNNQDLQYYFILYKISDTACLNQKNYKNIQSFNLYFLILSFYIVNCDLLLYAYNL